MINIPISNREEFTDIYWELYQEKFPPIKNESVLQFTIRAGKIGDMVHNIMNDHRDYYVAS